MVRVPAYQSHKHSSKVVGGLSVDMPGAKTAKEAFVSHLGGASLPARLPWLTHPQMLRLPGQHPYMYSSYGHRAQGSVISSVSLTKCFPRHLVRLLNLLFVYRAECRPTATTFRHKPCRGNGCIGCNATRSLGCFGSPAPDHIETGCGRQARRASFPVALNSPECGPGGQFLPCLQVARNTPPGTLIRTRRTAQTPFGFP